MDYVADVSEEVFVSPDSVSVCGKIKYSANISMGLSDSQ